MKAIKEVNTHIQVKEVNIRNELSALKVDYRRTKEFKGKLKVLENIPNKDVPSIIMFLINAKNKKPTIAHNDYERLAYYEEIDSILDYII